MPVINGMIAIYNAISSAIKYIVKILQIVNSILDTTIAIASGSIGPAAQKLEDALDRSTPVVIGFLADQIGLDDPSEAIGNIIVAIRIKVDVAIDWLIDKAFELGGALLESLGIVKNKKEENVDPNIEERKIKGHAEIERLVNEGQYDKTTLENRLKIIKDSFKFTRLEIEKRTKNKWIIISAMSPPEENSINAIPIIFEEGTIDGGMRIIDIGDREDPLEISFTWEKFYKKGIPDVSNFINRTGIKLNIPMEYEPPEDEKKRTNRKRMEVGTGPIFPSGDTIELHHKNQDFFGDLDETSAIFHQTFSENFTLILLM